MGCSIGAVYVYAKKNNQWIFESRLHSPDKNESNLFGRSVSLDNDTLIVADTGALYYYSNDKNQINNSITGAVYIFKRNNLQWNEIAKLQPKENTSETHFGKSVAIDKNTIVVGSEYTEKNTNNFLEKNYGQFYIFEKKNNSWKQVANFKILDISKRNRYNDKSFADSLDISANTIVVGNPLDFFNGNRGFNNDYYNNTDKSRQNGEVYLFKKHSGKWKKSQYLTNPFPLKWDHFGSSVKIKDKTIVVGRR